MIIGRGFPNCVEPWQGGKSVGVRCSSIGPFPFVDRSWGGFDGSSCRGRLRDAGPCAGRGSGLAKPRSRGGLGVEPDRNR